MARPEHAKSIAEATSLPAGLVNVQTDIFYANDYKRYQHIKVRPYFDRLYLPNGMWDVMGTAGQELMADILTPAEISAKLGREYKRLRLQSDSRGAEKRMSDLAKETQGFQHQKPVKPASLWWMYVPALATVFIFMIFPFVKGAFITFTNWNGFSQTYQWVGVTQYKRLFYRSGHVACCEKHFALRHRKHFISEYARTFICAAFESELKNEGAHKNDRLPARHYQSADYGIHLVFYFLI